MDREERQIGDYLNSDRYQIQSLLGKQTGRRTFLAQDLQTEKPVVIKLVLFGPDFTWQDLKLFEREAQTLQFLQHPAIPQYLESFEVETSLGKGFALVQTYIEAKSLQAWVNSGYSFSETELSAIAHSLLNILQYLHQRHPPIIHRDIKPSNILFQPSDNDAFTLFLVDFGSVQTVKTSGTMTVVGTYGYMPPEQFGGRAVPASDLYSLGATLIYLATGQHPADLIQDDMTIDFEQTSNLSAPFALWIRRLTYPDMARRIRTADAAQASLNCLKDHAPAHRTAPLAATASAHLSASTSINAPALPLQPTLADVTVSSQHQSLEIRCLSSRITEYSAVTESNQKLAKKATTPFALSALAFMGFWAALGLAILTDITSLIVVMIMVVILFGLLYPLFSAQKTKKNEEKILSFSSLEPEKITLVTETVPINVHRQSRQKHDSQLNTQKRYSKLTVRSFSTANRLTAQPHLIITLSSSEALGLSQLEISGTQREIQWLRDHIHQWLGDRVRAEPDLFRH